MNNAEHGIPGRSGTRVLIADDSLVSRHLLEATIRHWGYQISVACDGAEAWKILQRDDAPPLAILDWMMPGLTGPEVCKLVRQRNQEPYTYILLLTSRSLKEDVVEGMESGADDYLTKPFDQHELKVRLRAGTRIVTLQEELLATREAMRLQATHDYLTDLWNRAAILDILQEELVRSSRQRTPLGVVLVDLDRFKLINDTYGHFAGDHALQQATSRMQAAMRPYDSLGRYGGEEFLVILPGCDAECALSQAERMRLAMCDVPLQLADVKRPISASFGCTSIINTGEVTAEQLIRRADEALYLAKRRGRNRVEFLGSDAKAAADADIRKLSSALHG
ncbi:MAG TPA: diguanylate cyclase [Bryobacteraceae bacterium]|nr:diguanylate cyclase [Bryobacteraceae bacterium]